MSRSGGCNEFGTLTWRWEFFPLEYMAKVAITDGTDDLCEILLGPRLVFLSMDVPRDSYIANWCSVQKCVAMR